MAQRATAELTKDWETAIREMITEDDEPVDNRFTAKQQRLLVESVCTSWQPEKFEDTPNEERNFYADSNVGIFTSPFQPAIVPDMFLSLDVDGNADYREKENRSYCLWVFEKPPEAVVEIISDKRGGEFDAKMKRYAKLGVLYYVTFDPFEVYDAPHLRVYELAWGGRRYHLRKDFSLPEIGLSLKIRHGFYENFEADWLRWHDVAGNLILAGKEFAEAEKERAEGEKERAEAEKERAEAEKERAEAEKERAEAEKERAEAEKERAEAEKERAEAEKERAEAEKERADKLAEKLRELGIDPNSL